MPTIIRVIISSISVNPRDLVISGLARIRSRRDITVTLPGRRQQPPYGRRRAANGQVPRTTSHFHGREKLSYVRDALGGPAISPRINRVGAARSRPAGALASQALRRGPHRAIGRRLPPVGPPRKRAAGDH